MLHPSDTAERLFCQVTQDEHEFVPSADLTLYSRRVRAEHRTCEIENGGRLAAGL